jgi:ribokinase
VSGPVDVVVVGSLNRDYVCRVDVLPAPGQTVLGGEASVGSGGKGGNQAAAAALLGARTAMVGRVGEDHDGRALVTDLAGAGVDTGGVATSTQRTGMAFVLVDARGENAIVVAPGANAALGADETAEAVRELAAPAAVVVTQAEIPGPALDAAVRTAAELGCRAVVNLAPYRPVDEDVLALCDPLVVNESEAAALLGHVVGHDGAEAAARELSGRARSVVLTAGAKGAYVVEDDECTHVPARQVTAVDSTGAGDAFTGGLVVALACGRNVVAAAEWGARVAEHAVARPGAQASFPSWEEVDLSESPGPP